MFFFFYILINIGEAIVLAYVFATINILSQVVAYITVCIIYIFSYTSEKFAIA